jgi:16S rRNA (cytosine967-C5)-methyltransferase
VNTRLLALDALVRVEEGAFANVVLPTMLRTSGLRDRDRAFVTDLVYGSVRSERRLDDLVTRVARRPVRRLDPPVRAALRLGAYQLLHGVPAHAAVSETVDAVAARSPRARGFVNGALRALTRLGPPWPEPSREAVALSYPDPLVAVLVDALGRDDARAALAAMNEPPPVTLRVNPRRASPSAVAAELAGAGAAVEWGRLVGEALLVRGVGDPARLPVVADGRATPQDQASQAVVALLAPEPGDLVADVAAAPGGKTTAVAEHVGDAGAVVAVDVDAGRLRLVRAAASRLGLSRISCVVADGRAAPLRAGVFDRVLLDAPCTGLGALRRRPDARWRFEVDAIAELATRQRGLLAAAAALVCPGGTLVYSVCTLTREETVDVDNWAATQLPSFTAAAPPPGPWRPHGRGALLLPQDAATDGMFVLKLERLLSRASETSVPHAVPE